VVLLSGSDVEVPFRESAVCRPRSLLLLFFTCMGDTDPALGLVFADSLLPPLSGVPLFSLERSSDYLISLFSHLVSDSAMVGGTLFLVKPPFFSRHSSCPKLYPVRKGSFRHSFLSVLLFTRKPVFGGRISLRSPPFLIMLLWSPKENSGWTIRGRPGLLLYPVRCRSSIKE